MLATRQRPPKVPLVVLILVGATSFFATVYLFYTVITAFFFNDRQHHLLLRQQQQQERTGFEESDPSWAPIVQLGSTSCSLVQERLQKGIWHDPNEGRVFARKLITEPSFTIAVHNQTYDPVRWDTLFVQGKYYEDLVFSRFVKILSSTKHPKQSLVLDVGANIGFYTLLSATMGYPVVSFEINPANLVRLCESLRLNKHPSVSIFQRGVSNVDGTPLQVLVPKNPGQAFMREIDDPKGLEKLKIKTNDTSTHHAFTTTITLDAFGQNLGWLPKKDKKMKKNAASDWTVAILKLDVEGKEPQVRNLFYYLGGPQALQESPLHSHAFSLLLQIIEGAKELLNSGRVLNVLTEFRRLARPNIQEAIQTLLDAGYGLVDDETEGRNARRLNRKDSQAYLDKLTEKFKGKGRNFDFWFQRAS